MNWTIKEHKIGTGTAEIQVEIMVKEMAYYQAYNAESFIEKFKDNLKRIPATNSYSAEFSYKANQIDDKTLEVWKMKTNGDFNYKMFTVTKLQK